MSLGKGALSILRKAGMLLLYGILGSVFWGVPLGLLLGLFLQAPEKPAFSGSFFVDLAVAGTVTGFLVGPLVIRVIRLKLRRDRKRGGPFSPWVSALSTFLMPAVALLLVTIVKIAVEHARSSPGDFLGGISKNWRLVLMLATISFTMIAAFTFAARRDRKAFVRAREPMGDGDFLASLGFETDRRGVALAVRKGIAKSAGLDSVYVRPEDELVDLDRCYWADWDPTGVSLWVWEYFRESENVSVTFKDDFDLKLLRYYTRTNCTVADFIRYFLYIMDEHMERHANTDADGVRGGE